MRGRDFGFVDREGWIDAWSRATGVDSASIRWRFGDAEAARLPSRLLAKPRFMQHNMAVAFALYESLQWRHPDPLPALGELFAKLGEDQGPSAVCGFGRYLKIESGLGGERLAGRPLLIDVCHNVDGVEAHREAKQDDPSLRRPLALVSILSDKNINAMLDLLRLEYDDHILLFQIPNDRSLTQNDLAERHRGLKLFDSFELAWQHALKERPSRKDSLVVCGSVLAVGHVLEYFKLYPLEMARHMAAL